MQLSSRATDTREKGGEKKEMTTFIGIDIAKKNCVVCIRDQNDAIREITSYRNTSEEASSFAKRVVEVYGECNAVVESTKRNETQRGGVNSADPRNCAAGLQTRGVRESR